MDKLQFLILITYKRRTVTGGVTSEAVAPGRSLIKLYYD